MRTEATDLDTLRRQGEGGDLWAQLTLGEMYRYGRGMQQDPAEAARWYRLAAEGRHNTAAYELGMLLLSGEGVPEDPAAAAEWFYQAATGNHPDAQHQFRQLHAVGRGVPKDPEKARWFSHAADLDQPEPWYWHGMMGKRGMVGRAASKADFTAGGGLLMMTGPADDKTCRTCLDELGVVRTAEEWEEIAPGSTSAGLHDGCRCAWRRLTRIDRALEEMQRTFMLQVDVQRWLRGIYWRPIVVLGKGPAGKAATPGDGPSSEETPNGSSEPRVE